MAASTKVRANALWEITFALRLLDNLINLNNCSGLTDVNKKAEDFFCGFFNIFQTWRLQNMNYTRMDYPAIDLGDEENHIAVQISSTQTKDKFQNTLTKFIEYKLYEKFTTLCVIGLGNKPKHNLRRSQRCKARLTSTKDISKAHFPIEIINIYGLAIPIPVEKLNALYALISVSNSSPQHLPPSPSTNTTQKPDPKVLRKNLKKIVALLNQALGITESNSAVTEAEEAHVNKIIDFVKPFMDWPSQKDSTTSKKFWSYVNVDDILAATELAADDVLQKLADYVVNQAKLFQKYMPERFYTEFSKLRREERQNALAEAHEAHQQDHHQIKELLKDILARLHESNIDQPAKLSNDSSLNLTALIDVLREKMQDNDHERTLALEREKAVRNREEAAREREIAVREREKAVLDREEVFNKLLRQMDSLCDSAHKQK